MMRKLLALQWKEAVRSPFWQKSIALNILLGLIVLYFALNFFVLGLFLDRLLIEAFPNTDPVSKFNSFFLFYLLFDLILRFFVQQFPALSIQPYLHLPVSKSKLFHYLLLKSVPNVINVFPFLLIIPFFIKAVIPVYSLLGSIAWISTMICLVLMSNFWGYYLKKIFSVSLILPIVILLLAGVLFYLDLNEYIGLSSYFGNLIDGVLAYPYLVVISFTLLFLSYFFLFRQMKRYAYVEEIAFKSNQSKAQTTDFQFLKRYGKMGEIIQLELKLIWRNKRPRTMVLMGLIFPLYFIFMFSSNLELLDSTFFLIFAGVFITGMVVLQYGQFMLSWESSFFDCLLTKNLSFKDYFHGMYLLFAIACGVLTVLFTPALFIDIRLGMVIIALGLFNIGVTTITLFFFSLFNKKRINLGKSAFFNYEGMGAAQFLLMLPILIAPIVIFILASWLGGSDYVGIATLGLIGLIAILLKTSLINFIVDEFKPRRYGMAAGFRKKINCNDRGQKSKKGLRLNISLTN